MNRRAQIAKVSPRLAQSPAFQRWLDEPVFALSDVSLSRREVAALTDTPCTRAASNLDGVCRHFKIESSKHLFHVGLSGLLRCRGIGERSAWIAACVLYQEGYNVKTWASVERRGVRTVKGAIRLVHSQTRKQKHG